MLGKGSIDWKERADTINAENKLLENALQAQISDLKQSLRNRDTNVEERINIVATQVNEKF